ncbi:translocation and assembly module lipoprotein TamL [Pelobium manganitolerans]|uniref:translocation and assembly module lipoprotein TamL n=1 Tax=Pelobium manganitolerans TaxID=1842495 RepID=UPI001FE7A442|nr:BamA/TamA family outer membrane protein [Pelobium manganitolerans]
MFIALGCRSTKRLSKDEALVTKLTINGVDEPFADQAEDFVALDIRPNSPFNLWLYNTFSRKGKLKIGEAPHLLDSSLVEISRNQIEKFLNIKGYLNAKVKDSISIKNKRAHVVFTAIPGTEFKFRNISFDVADSAVKEIYLNNRKSFTRIDSGKRYDTDSIAFEREQIYLLMKQNGYYDFVRQYMRPTVDTNFNAGVADIQIAILNPPGLAKHPIYTLGDTYVRIQPSSGIIAHPRQDRDTVVIDSQYRFYDYSHFFKPKKFVDYIYLDKGDIYNISNADLTTQRFFDLNAFRSVSVDFAKSKDSSKRELVGLMDIIPLKKKSNRLDGEYTFNSSITGLNAGLTYQNRNFFGGAELFEVKLRGGVQFDKNVDGSLSDRLLSRDFQVGVSLSFPRLITPFNIRSSGRNGIPHTRIASSYQNYRLTQSYLRKSLGFNLTYDWVETKYKLHSFTPVNISYSNALISADLAQLLISQGNAFFLSTLRSQLLSSSYYTYTVNLPKLTTYNNFTFFSGTAEIGGNSAALAAQLSNKYNSDGQKLLFGVPYYQYVKLETDVRFYKSFGGERQLVVRVNPGVGYSYGNVKSLPFDKRFFAGGSSGIRAWQARTLGPGNYNRASLASDSARFNLRNLDQLGDVKFEGNIEYRFKLIKNFIGSKVKGATFIDFGNVWQLRDNGLDGGQLKFNKLFEQTAIGVGLGLRFDVSFFVFRLDAGFKFKDPQFRGDDQYVVKYWFDREGRNRLKSNYAITNAPDKYSISQIQFGIGMPF